MHRAALTLLTLLAGVALAQNPFRDLAAQPEPEEDPTTTGQPITINIPETPLPPPPLNIDNLPTLPVPGGIDTTPTGETVTLPADPVILALPDLPTLATPQAQRLKLNNPLHALGDAHPQPLLHPLAPPDANHDDLTAEEGAAHTEPAEEKQSSLCVDVAALATSGGLNPTALVRCSGVTHLLRVGDTIPGTSAAIQSIETLSVTITLEGRPQQLQVAAH